MIKIAICDDEQLARNGIEELLKANYGDELQISCYESTEALLDTWERGEGQEDILLLDIRFEGLDGISAARKLQDRNPRAKIIFITGYIDYATEIFRAEPIYFLTKPVKGEKLVEAVEKAKSQMQKESCKSVMCSSKNGIVKVEVDKIYYLESDRRILYVHEETRTLTLNQKLPDMEKQLPDSFLRCHQSFLVNMKYIRSFSRQEIELVDGRKVPVSRPKYAAARKDFLKYLGTVV